jgi:hypothetical protein
MSVPYRDEMSESQSTCCLFLQRVTYKVSITEITNARHDKLLLIEMRINHSSDDTNARIGSLHSSNALGSRNEVQKDNVLLHDAVLKQNTNGTIGRTTSGQHWVEKQNLALGNVLWQLDVDQLGERSLFVALNQNLANANRLANRTKRS